MGCTIEKTLKHVLFLTRRFDENDVESAILVILLELGFSTQSDGFYYLREAILLKYRNPSQRFAKVLYPAISGYHDPGIGSMQIEQAIRSAISSAWCIRDEEEWSYFFSVGKGMKKPSNGEFISRIACILELWHRCYKEVCYETK